MKRNEFPSYSSFRVTKADKALVEAVRQQGIRETARRTMLSPGLVSSWINGTRGVSEETARKICESAGVAWPM